MTSVSARRYSALWTTKPLSGLDRAAGRKCARCPRRPQPFSPSASRISAIGRSPTGRLMTMPSAPLLVVPDHQDDGAAEPRIAHGRRGDQKLAGRASRSRRRPGLRQCGLDQRRRQQHRPRTPRPDVHDQRQGHERNPHGSETTYPEASRLRSPQHVRAEPPMPRDKARIAIATGDPAGIGPEISLKAALDPAVRAACDPILVSDPGVIERHAKACGIAADHARDRAHRRRATFPAASSTCSTAGSRKQPTLHSARPSPISGRASIAFVGRGGEGRARRRGRRRGRARRRTKPRSRRPASSSTAIRRSSRGRPAPTRTTSS